MDERKSEILAQFQGITGIDDLDHCRQLLDIHHWELENALHAELDSGSTRRSTNFSQRSTNMQTTISPNVAISRSSNILKKIFQMCYSIIYWIKHFYADDAAIRFSSEFEKSYGQHHVQFYPHSYSHALQEAKDHLKFVLVYLHSSDHQDTRHFCQETLCNSSLINFLSTSHVLVWGGNVNQPDGHHASLSLSACGYPFVALLMYQGNRLSMLFRMNGFLSANELMGKVRNAIAIHSAAFDSLRQQREERELARMLREEQEEAFRASLQADQEKERANVERKAAEKRADEVKKFEEIAQLEKQDKKKAIMLRKEKIFSEEPIASEKDVVQVVVRLPSGRRLQRRFRDSDSLQLVYDFVFVSEEFENNFKLVTNFPRVVYEPTDMSLKDAHLAPNAALFVEEIFEEDQPESSEMATSN